jgi:hypothetical protein
MRQGRPLIFLARTRASADEVSKQAGTLRATRLVLQALGKANIGLRGPLGRPSRPPGAGTTPTASSEALNGTDRVYFMQVHDNHLRMQSPGVIVPMTGATSIVEIELGKAD